MHRALYDCIGHRVQGTTKASNHSAAGAYIRTLPWIAWHKGPFRMTLDTGLLCSTPPNTHTMLKVGNFDRRSCAHELDMMITKIVILALITIMMI